MFTLTLTRFNSLFVRVNLLIIINFLAILTVDYEDSIKILSTLSAISIFTFIYTTSYLLIYTIIIFSNIIYETLNKLSIDYKNRVTLLLLIRILIK